MIMQRIEGDGDFFEPLPGFIDLGAETLDQISAPGMMYRGVPQNPDRRSLRIDFVRAAAAPLTGPAWIVTRRQCREMNMSELHFG